MQYYLDWGKSRFRSKNDLGRVGLVLGRSRSVRSKKIDRLRTLLKTSFLKFWSLFIKIPHFPFYKINFVFSTHFEHIHYYSGQADMLMKSENITSVMTLQNKIIYHNGDLQKAKLFWDTGVLFPARKLQICP